MQKQNKKTIKKKAKNTLKSINTKLKKKQKN